MHVPAFYSPMYTGYVRLQRNKGIILVAASQLVNILSYTFNSFLFVPAHLVKLQTVVTLSGAL